MLTGAAVYSWSAKCGALLHRVAKLLAVMNDDTFAAFIPFLQRERGGTERRLFLTQRC